MKSLTVVFTLIITFNFFAPTALAQFDRPASVADTSGQYCIGLPLFDQNKNCYDNFSEYFRDLVALITNVAAFFAILLIVYAGFTYTTSQGDAAKINGAREIVTGSLSGLALLLLIRLILPTLNIN